jgi:1-deoxy-D-xylulose-5-phosphate reductoisomerase
MNKPLNITVLGSTGSIGVSTLDVIAQHTDQFKVIALTACKATDRLYQQCMKFQPRYAVMANADAAEQLQKRLQREAPHIEVLAGTDAITRVAGLDEVDYVMAAIVGSAGLLPTLEAARKGKRILLANKEALVMSGELFMQEVHNNKAVLLPVDSEHNAIFQCMPSDFRLGHDMPDSVEQVLLTGSGGPFRNTPLNILDQVTPDQACAHPNWSMGRKISVDSATMMNKGLEVIEACWLFSLSIKQIQVVIHPQSVIHSLVQYQDGSVLAQLGKPDMRTPIAHALAWPQRIQSGVGPLDLVEIGRLDFEKPDYQRFPCLSLAYQAWKTGGTASAVLNAANEVAVQAFLEGDLAFSSIAGVIEKTLENTEIQTAESVEAILGADKIARMNAHALLSVKQKQVMS